MADNITRQIMDNLSECMYVQRLSVLQSMADSVQTDEDRVTVLCWLTKELVHEVEQLRQDQRPGAAIPALHPASLRHGRSISMTDKVDIIQEARGRYANDEINVDDDATISL